MGIKMMTKANKIPIGGFRVTDFLVIIIFLSIAAISINLFRLDFLQTINLRNVDPVGTVVIRKNVVQRRLSDRVLWDRLANESPVYLGDLIRVAEFSAATLNLKGNSIDLNENTLIRITLAADGESLQIIMSEGNLSLSSAQDSGRISLDINGMQIRPDSGSIININYTEEGTVINVNEGSVFYIEEGREVEVQAGIEIKVVEGVYESYEKPVTVTRPVYNAQYINGSSNSLPVDFNFTRNTQTNDVLRLEISSDSRFNRINYTRSNPGGNTQIELPNGQWYWRLVYANPAAGSPNPVLEQGRLTITGGSETQLMSPAQSSIIRFTDDLPVFNLQWNETPESTSYVLQICDSPAFANPRTHRSSNANYFIDSDLGEGTWYWRVMPVFPDIYIGNPSFSQASSFTIEHIAAQTEHQELAQWIEEQIPPDLIKPAAPPVLLLTSPAYGARLDGLTASRQQTIFTWEIDASITSSRFVLSGNPDPFAGQPAIEIHNPDRNIFIWRLDQGTWYWNIEVQTANGFTVRAENNGIVFVSGIPPLAAATNLQPARGHRISMSELQNRRNLNFTWREVQGANAYIFTLFHQSGSGRRQIYRSQPVTRGSYSFESLRLLDQGTFIWQIEAISRAADGSFERRGNMAESSFTMDIVLPGTIQIQGSGVQDENQ